MRPMIDSSRLAALGCIAMLALAIPTAVFAAPAVPSDRQIAAEQVEVSALADQVDALDAQASELQEKQRSAVAREHDIESQLEKARSSAKRADRRFAAARKRLLERSVAIYKAGGGDSTLAMFVQAGSIDAMFDRLDATRRVSGEDRRIVVELRALRKKADARRASLTELRADQITAVRAANRAKAKAEAKLGQRQRLLSSANARMRSLVDRKRAAAAAVAAAQSREIANRITTTDPAGASDNGGSNPTGLATTFSPLTPAPSSGGGSGSAAVAVAMRYIGTPYVWGGSSPSGFDCSGLVQYSYAQVGVSLPRTTYSQWDVGHHVERSELQTGDLVFFDGLGHMGMYVGGGNFIHAPHTGDVVKISSLNDSWYADTYQGAVRV